MKITERTRIKDKIKARACHIREAVQKLQSKRTCRKTVR